jgi:hypothetical protein
VINHVSPEQHDRLPLDATAALRNMAESAAYANRVLASDGSYNSDDAVCASAATVAVVCEILCRLVPFLGEAWRMARADVPTLLKRTRTAKHVNLPTKCRSRFQVAMRSSR